MTCRFSPGDFCRITDGPYCGMSGRYVGSGDTSWLETPVAEQGRYVLVQLTAWGRIVGVRPEQVRRDQRESDKETA